MTPGLRIGKYEVGTRLGKGSFGVVHLARDVELGREVAIKFLRPEFSTREQIVQRFLQEARAAAKIGHGGIVTVFECGVISGTRHDGTAYIVMERLQGDSLGDRIASKQPWTYTTIIAIGRQLALALHAAHAAGIIHRDLKPDNVFLVPDAAVVGGERAKILDFGIAKLDDPAGIHTHSKMILGTPRYMSPEQARSSTNVDARTDVYALGCMLYEMVCGRTPFEGDTGDIMFHHQATEAPAPTTLVDNVPPALDALLRRMLAKQPDQRPANMLAVDQALDAIDADDVAPAVRAKARFVSQPAVSDIADPPRPKRISAAGELSTRSVEDKPPQRETGARIKVDLDALPSPSEEFTVPAKPVAHLLQRASEPTFKALLDPTTDNDSTDRDREPWPVAHSTLATRRGSNNMVWFAAAGGVLFLLALVMVVRCSGGSKPVPDAPVATEPVVIVDTPVVVDATDPDQDAERIRNECRIAQVKRNWTALDGCGHRLMKLVTAEGSQLIELARSEATAEIALRTVKAAGDLVAAEAAARDILETSTYRTEADDELARLRAKTAAPAPVARPTRPKVTVTRPPPPPPERPAACDDLARVAQLERTGDEAAQTGSYAAALVHFEAVFRCKPGVGIASKAYINACKGRNFPKAKIYFKAVGKESLAQICLKEGYDPRL